MRERGLFEVLADIERKQDYLMAATDDLTAAVAALVAEQVAVDTAVTNLVAEVAALKAANPGIDTAAVEAAVTAIQGVTAQQSTDAAVDPGVAPA